MRKPPLTRRDVPGPGPRAVMLVTLLCACAPPTDGPPAVVVRDSAGIAIVESFRPVWGDSAGWLIDPEPLIDLAESGTGDPHNFYGVRSMKRLSGGSLVVANRGSNEIRMFSADGAFVRSAGGNGEGPGEFSNLQQIVLAGDSIIAQDIRSRVTLFGPELEHIRTMRLDDYVRGLRHLGGGTVVVQAVMHFPELYGLVRYPEALLLYDLEGTRGDSIGSTPGAESYVTEVLSGTPLFIRQALVETHKGRIYTGASDHMQVEELDSRGDTVRILRIPDFPLSLTAEQVEAERQARLDIPLPQGVTSLPPHLVEALENMPSPETRPAYRSMRVDPTGAIWLSPFLGFSEEGGPEDWQVLDAAGAWLGSVEVPENFQVMDIGIDEILGVWTDELDVQHPQVRRLSRDGVYSVDR